MANADDNTPSPGTVDSARDHGMSREEISGILGDSAHDEPNTDESGGRAGEPEPKPDPEDPAPEGEDDGEEEAEGEDPDDSGEEAPEDSDDEPEDTGGRFVGDDARIRLADGTTTTVQELKKSYFRQSDYTRKRQEDAEARQRLDANVAQVSQIAQELDRERSKMAAMLEQWKPKPPQDPNNLNAYVQYQRDKENWESWNRQLEGDLEERRRTAHAEQREQLKAYSTEENTRLLAKMPELADPAKRRAFTGELVQWLGEKYEFAPEEIGSIADHRQVVLLRDFMRMSRRQEKAPEVRKQIERKPKMLRSGKRGGDPKASARREKAERLARTGRSEDAVAILMEMGDD